jgi:acyl dehydratase
MSMPRSAEVSSFGNVIAHGMNVALSAIERYLAARMRQAAASLPDIARIQLQFPKPVFVDECLSIVCVSADRKRTRLSVRRQQSDLAKITLVWRETVNEAGKHRSAALASQLRVEPPRRDPVRRKIEDGDGVAGKLPLQVGGDRLTHAPPRCVDWLGERALAGLSLLSTILGMEWPGIFALRYSGRRRSGSSGVQGDLYRDGLRPSSCCGEARSTTMACRDRPRSGLTRG